MSSLSKLNSGILKYTLIIVVTIGMWLIYIFYSHYIFKSLAFNSISSIMLSILIGVALPVFLRNNKYLRLRHLLLLSGTPIFLFFVNNLGGPRASDSEELGLLLLILAVPMFLLWAGLILGWILMINMNGKNAKSNIY